MKKILTAILTAALILSLAACERQTNNPNPPPNSNPGTESSAPSAPSSSEEPAVSVSVEDIFASLHESFGEDYLATASMEADYMAEVYALSPDWYEEVMGEMAMISMHPDEAIIVKAKPGKADKVEEALIKAMEAKKANGMQYPMNVPKTEASRVVRNGDYVAYLLLGAQPQGNDLDEAAYKTHFEAQAQQAEDAFNEAIAG